MRPSHSQPPFSTVAFIQPLVSAVKRNAVASSGILGQFSGASDMKADQRRARLRLHKDRAAALSLFSFC